MSKWGFNRQPKCSKCGRFILRELKSHLCDDCYAFWHEQVGKVPDEQIPREVLKAHRHQEAKRQADIEIERRWHEADEMTKHIRCSCCHRPYDFTDAGWRFTGTGWEHKCPNNHPQAGYFAAEPIPADEYTVN